MSDITKEIQQRLFEMQDTGYRQFQAKLMPTVAPDTVIGVRIPMLRAYAKELVKQRDIRTFLAKLPHAYYEENNLHGFFIEGMCDYDRVIAELNRFLPYVNNWATCDLMTPKIFKTRREALLVELKRWLASDDIYAVRFGIKMLMSFYLDDVFEEQYADMVASVESEEYYIKMMQAWYFATALAKHYTRILPYIEERRLEPWTHNKAIQKAIESLRITDAQKTYLRTLKIKGK